MMIEKIKVNIGGSCTVQIAQTVEMSVADFERLDKELDSDDRLVRKAAREEIEAYVDWSDILDFDDLEIDNFEADKSKEPS